jgi:hypothetical protein
MMADKKLSNVRSGAAEVEAEPGSASASASAAKAKPNQIDTLDELGRRIVVKRLNALEKMRLTRLAGADSGNAGYASYLMLAASLVSIDGEPEAFPQTIRAVEAIVAQLGDEGLEVVGRAALELNGIASEQEDRDRAKN